MDNAYTFYVGRLRPYHQFDSSCEESEPERGQGTPAVPCSQPSAASADAGHRQASTQPSPSDAPASSAPSSPPARRHAAFLAQPGVGEPPHDGHSTVHRKKPAHTLRRRNGRCSHRRRRCLTRRARCAGSSSACWIATANGMVIERIISFDGAVIRRRRIVESRERTSSRTSLASSLSTTRPTPLLLSLPDESLMVTDGLGDPSRDAVRPPVSHVVLGPHPLCGRVALWTVICPHHARKPFLARPTVHAHARTVR
jgi:hypothetical protein